MKKKIVISSLIIFIMAAITYVPVIAATDVVIALAENQVWTTGYHESRSGDYSYVLAQCSSVYPLEGTDNFEIIQVRVRDSIGAVISEYSSYDLDEKSLGYTMIDLKQGSLGVSDVFFQFRGNKKYPANAVVSYEGM